MRTVLNSLTGLLLLAGCTAMPEKSAEVKHYPLDSMEGLITRSGGVIDKKITSDGGGSLRIETDRPLTFRLYETGDLDVENTRLIYRAKLRTQDVEGIVYVEMWCSFPEKGEYFSRALHAPLSGTNEWSTQETPFLLQKGENPVNIKMNLVIDGSGTVWIDDIRLLQAPLN
jgi:hypothetical protein